MWRERFEIVSFVRKPLQKRRLLLSHRRIRCSGKRLIHGFGVAHRIDLTATRGRSSISAKQAHPLAQRTALDERRTQKRDRELTVLIGPADSNCHQSETRAA